MVTCQYCKFEARGSEFGNHEETCELRPKKCLYCDQILEFDRYLNHVEQCGARTFKCERCGAFVKNKDRDSHGPSGECDEQLKINERKE